MSIEGRVEDVADVLRLAALRRAGGGPQSIEALASRGRPDWATLERRYQQELARGAMPRANGGSRLPMPIQKPGQSGIEHAMNLARWKQFGQ